MGSKFQRFRVKNKKTGEWFYLTLEEVFVDGWERSIYPIKLHLDWSTVGVWVGHRDKHGVEIYQGDIVKQKGIRGGCYNNKDRLILIDTDSLPLYADGYYSSENEVVGNEHDNIELGQKVKYGLKTYKWLKERGRL